MSKLTFSMPKVTQLSNGKAGTRIWITLVLLHSLQDPVLNLTTMQQHKLPWAPWALVATREGGYLGIFSKLLWTELGGGLC